MISRDTAVSLRCHYTTITHPVWVDAGQKTEQNHGTTVRRRLLPQCESPVRWNNFNLNYFHVMTQLFWRHNARMIDVPVYGVQGSSFILWKDIILPFSSCLNLFTCAAEFSVSLKSLGFFDMILKERVQKFKVRCWSCPKGSRSLMANTAIQLSWFTGKQGL